MFFNSFTIFTLGVCKVSITFLSFTNYLEIKPLKKFSELKRHAAKAHPGSKLFNLSSSNPHRQCLPCSVLVKVQFKTFETTKNLVCVIFRLKVFAFCNFSLTLIQTLKLNFDTNIIIYVIISNKLIQTLLFKQMFFF